MTDIIKEIIDKRRAKAIKAGKKFSIKEYGEPTTQTVTEDYAQTDMPETEGIPTKSVGDYRTPLNRIVDRNLGELNRLEPTFRGQTYIESDDEEKQFKEWIKTTDWFKEGVKKGIPDYELLHEAIWSDKYDYRGAFRDSQKSQKNSTDGLQHWPSKDSKGNWLKLKGHPTAWKESFFEITGKNPDDIGIKDRKQADEYVRKFRNPLTDVGTPFEGTALPDSTPTVQDPKVFFDEFKNTRMGKILFRDFETKTPEDKVKFLQSIYSRYGNFDKDKLKPTIQKYDQDNSVLAGIKDWIGIQAPQMIEGTIGMLSQIPTRVNYGDTERPKQKPITNPFGLTDVRKKNEAYRQEFAVQSPLVAEFTQNFMNIVPVIATGGTAGLIGGAPAAFAASIATGFAMEGGSAYQEAYDYTKDPDTALGVGIAVGTINSILNAIPIKGMAERQTAGVIKRFTRSLLNTKGKKEAVKKIGMAVLGEAHKTGKSELITEGLQELPNLIAEFLYKQGEDKPEFKEAADRILKAAASGYFIAGSIGAGGGVSQAVSGAKQGNVPIDRQARMREMAETPEGGIEIPNPEELTETLNQKQMQVNQEVAETKEKQPPHLPKEYTTPEEGTFEERKSMAREKFLDAIEQGTIFDTKQVTSLINEASKEDLPLLENLYKKGLEHNQKIYQSKKSAQPETPPKTPDIKTPETTPADAKQPVVPEPVQSEQPSVETGTEPSAQAVPAITEEVKPDDMSLDEYKSGMELTDDVEAARGYIDYLPEGKDRKKAEQIIAEYEKTKPFTVDDKLIFSKNGINTEVNFRGYDKDGNAVVVSKSGQFTVGKEDLYRPGTEPQTEPKAGEDYAESVKKLNNDSTIPDFDNVHGSNWQEFETFKKSFDDEITSLKKKKGSTKDKTAKKQIDDRLNAINDLIAEKELEMYGKQEQIFEKLKGLVKDRIGKDIPEDDLATITENVAESIFNRPGREYYWNKNLSEIIDSESKIYQSEDKTESVPQADTPSDPAMLDMIKRGKTDEEIVSALDLSKEQQKELKGLRESATPVPKAEKPDTRKEKLEARKPKAEVKETPKPKEVAKVTPRTEEQQKAIDNFKKENVEKLFKNITNPEDAEKAVEELIFDGYPITHPKGIAGYLKNPTKKLPAWVKNSLRDIGNTEVAKEISGDEVAITPVKVKQNQSTEVILQDITPNNDPLREFMGTIYHDKGRGNIVATDGHTMVVLGSGTDKEGAYYTPERKKKELQDFAKTLPGDKEALADYAKRIEEPANIKYPNYWGVIPADPNKDKFTLDLTDDLIGKIETISMVNKAGDLPSVTGAFKIGESEILFSPYNFNRVYKALKSAGAQDLTAYISDKGRAIVILDKNNPTKYTGLVMPIRKVAREHGKDIVTEPIILSDTTPNQAFPKEYIEAHKLSKPKKKPIDQAIDDVKADTNDLSVNPFFNPKAYKNLIKVGGAFIKQGATNFKDWSAKMLSSFGAKIRPHLRKLWSQTLDWVNRKIDAKYGTEKLKSEQKERLAKLAGIDLTPEPEEGVSPLEPLQRFSGRWVYEKLGEQYRAVEELVENIARAGIELSDAEDPYLNISLSPGVLERRTKDLLEPAVKKMAKKLQSAGISIEDFSDYLYARSAKTRNQIIAQRQIEEQEEARVSAEEAGKEFKPKDIMTNGSGLTDEQADKIMDAFKKKENFDAYESSANDFWDSVIKPNIDLLYESGRIDEATRDEFLARKDYVPLKGVDYEMHSSTNSGSGYTVNNRGFYTAEGRESLAQNNTFLQMLEDFQSNIVGSVKNQAGQSLLKALEKAPSSMYEITGARANQRLKDNQVSVYVDGKRKIITFKGEGEQISNALRNLDQSQVTHFGKVVDGINDYFRNVHTISNPEFVVPNALMDAQMGIVGLYADHGAGMVKKLFSNKGANLKFALRGLLDDMSGKDSPEADYYKNVYQKSGAKVGWVNTMELSQRYEEIQTLMKEAEKGVGNVKAIIRLVQALTNVSDNLIRLSVHKTLTDSGMSPKRASLYTRRLTVDFNRKGTWSKSVGRMYLFANAVAQGALRVKNIIGGKRGKKVMGGLVAAGAIQALMNIMLGEDEYESLINNREGILDTHWVIMVPGGGSVRVKSVPGLNFFTNLGRQAVETAFGLRTPGSALSSAIGNAFNSVNIMGESGDFWQWLSPTFTDPIIQGIQNKDFAGNPIRPLPRYKEDKPQSQKYFKTVGVPFKLLSEGLNAMTGGSKYRSGGVDISPNDFEFAFEALTGGLGRFTTKVAKTATAPLAEEYGISDMPFLSRFGLPPQEKAPENIVYRMLQQAPTKEFTDRQKKYFERNVDIMVKQGKEDSKKGNTLKREFEREQSDDYKELRSVIKEAKAGGEKDWSKFRNLTVKLLRSRIITRQDLEKYKKEMR